MREEPHCQVRTHGLKHWGKIVAIYSIAAIAAFGRLAHGATAPATVSLAQINLAGDYSRRPLIADIHCDPTSPEFPRLWVQLAAMKYERFRAVGKQELVELAALNKLRAEHRELMNGRNGTGNMDDSVERAAMESGWSMAMFHNVTKQATVKSRLARTSGAWDAAHQLTVRYRERGGKKIFVRLEGASGKQVAFR